MNKGFVFTLMAVLIALSLFALFTNYRLYASEVASSSIRDISVSAPFDYVATGLVAIADLDVAIEKNRTHTFVNFTDRAPRASGFNQSLDAYQTFLIKKMNYTYDVVPNFTQFILTPVFDVSGFDAEYNYSNFNKDNITFVAKRNGHAIEQYDINITVLDPAAGAATISTVSSTAGNLTLRIFAGSETSVNAVSRTDTSSFRVTFAGISGSVEVRVGLVDSFTSTLRVSPSLKSEIKTVATIRTAGIPAG